MLGNPGTFFDNSKARILVCFVTTIGAFALSFWLMGQDPPSSVGTIINLHVEFFFPFAWLTALTGHAQSLAYPLALFQFPAYSVALQWAWIRRRFVLVALFLVLIHLSDVALCRIVQ